MAEKALDGYRVLDLSDESGVYGTKLLADLGADVIRVEPHGGDHTRRLPPFYRDQVGTETSLFHAYMNTNKRSITLNLETTEGQSLFQELAQRADVVFETFASGHLSRLGIGYAELRELNPGLVWAAVTPFGQTGPRRDWKGSNLIGWAQSSVLFQTGDPDRPPLAPGGPMLFAYQVASINAAAGALLALRGRKRIGVGQMVDVSVQESAVGITSESGLPAYLDDSVPRRRVGLRRLSTRPFGLYPCKDGHAAVIIVMPAHWQALASWIRERTGVEEVMDPAFNEGRYRFQLVDLVDHWAETLTLQYDKQELFEEGQRRGISITPVNTLADLGGDPHLEARHYWTETSHPVLGQMRMAGPPYRLSKTPWQSGRAPLLGEHNEAIYCGELGLTREDLAVLTTDGVI